MARPSTSELSRRQTRLARTVRDSDDPHAQAALVSFKRRMLKRFRQDADFWYDAIRSVALFPDKDHGPLVRMLTEVLRSAVPEQRTFPTKPAEETVKPPMVFNVIFPEGVVVQRGTAEARQAAIDAQASKRQLLTHHPAVGEAAMAGETS